MCINIVVVAAVAGRSSSSGKKYVFLRGIFFLVRWVKGYVYIYA